MSRIDAVAFAAHDPDRLASFWAGVLERDRDDRDVPELAAGADPDFRIRFWPTQEPKWGPNKIHFDLTSTSEDDQQAIVERALALGGRHIDIGQRPEEGHIVLADPEGNELCVIEPGNNFLAGTAAIGALSCDGSQAVGYFWAGALDWPLVWDQDEETAIQSPAGGSKIAWGGPPLDPKLGPNRVWLDLVGAQDELERLLDLGATALDTGHSPWMTLADPDGNEFRLSTI